jgi:hypothetical protein
MARSSRVVTVGGGAAHGRQTPFLLECDEEFLLFIII